MSVEAEYGPGGWVKTTQPPVSRLAVLSPKVYCWQELTPTVSLGAVVWDWKAELKAKLHPRTKTVYEAP